MNTEHLPIATLFFLGTLFFCIRRAISLKSPDRQITGSLSLLILVFTLGLCLTLSSAFMVRKTPPSPVLFGLLGLFTLAGVTAASVLAIVGLALWSGRKEGVSRGKKSAIATLVCACLVLSGSVASVILRKPSSAGPSVAARPGGNRIELQEENFSVRPDAKWMRLSKPSNVNPAACLAMRTIRPEMWMIAIVEDATGVDAELYKDIIRDNFRRLDLSVSAEEDFFSNSHGFTFHGISASGKVQSIDLIYCTWLAFVEGRAYQMTFWAPATSKNLKAESRSFLESFRTTGNPLKETMTEVDAPEWGVRTALGAVGWSDWSKDDPLPLHCLKAAKKQNQYLQVISVRWMDPSPDQDAATAGMLGLLEIPYPSGVENQKPWKSPSSPVDGMDFRSTAKRDGKEILSLVRVAHHGSQSWLISAWGESGGDEKALAEALDAVALAPPTGEIREKRPRTTAFALNGAGLFHYSAGRYEKAEFFLGQSVRQDPADPVILGNRLDALAELGRHEDKLRAISEAPESVRKSNAVILSKAAALIELERPLEADALYQGLLESKSLDDDNALNWIRSLVASQNGAKALEAAKAYASARPSVKSGRWLAQTHAANEEYPAALELMETLAKENPHQHDLRFDLAEMFNQASKPAEAEALVRKLIADGQDGFRAQAALGYSFMNRKWYRQAKTSFEAALKLAPNDEDIRTALEECSALLGQGKNSDIKDPIKPVEIPSVLAKKLEERKPQPPEASDHARYLKHLTGWHFVPGKSLRKTETQVIEILDASAIPDFSSLQFSFDPTFERIHANRLEVFGPDGKRVATGNVDDFYVLDNATDMADDGKTMHLPVPGLAVAHRIEVQVTREYLNAPRTFPYERLLFGARLPVVSESVFLTGDVSSIRSNLTLGEKVESISDPQARIWLAKPSAGYYTENGSPDLEDYTPSLRLTGENSTWEEAGKEYLKQIETQLKPAGKDVTGLVGKIAPPGKSMETRAADITAHVQRAINYHAVEFGLRGRIPRTADDTLNRRQGDCKDHALLLHKMLDAAGIPSSLVLVHTSRNVDAGLPTLDQFNHMIVHVPCLSPCPFVDPTSKASKPGELPPFGMDQANALVLDPKKPYLGKLPSIPDSSATLKISRSVDFREDGSLTVEERTVFGGYYGEWIRNFLAGQTKARQLAAIQKIFASYNSSRIESMEFPDPADPLQKAEMKLRYQVPAGTDRQASPPMAWETDYLDLAVIQKREAPYELSLPIHIESETSLSAPNAFSAAYVKSLEKTASNDYCKWSLKPAAGENRTLKLAYRFEASPKAWPAERYDDLREAWRASLEASRRKIEFEKVR